MTLINRENTTCHFLNEHQNVFKNSSIHCTPDFDRSLCWYNVSFGQNGHKQCPFTFCPSVPGCENVAVKYHVNRFCHLNGTWSDSVYTGCIDLLKSHSHCIVGYCRTCPDLLRETVINVSLTLSVISVGVLVSALILFSLFDSLQCRRLSIHKNLALAFVFRFAVLAIWTIANTSNAFRDCTHFNPMPLRHWEWLCKGILWLVIYFQVASVMWMLIEGLYLYSRFTMFGMRHNESPYFIYLFSGWGIPFIVVCSWAIVHENRSQFNRHSFCWLPYAQGPHLWILAGTMGLALILNVLFLLAIVVILVQKLQSENSAESKKIWKTVKATILLVPLLGISNIPLFYEPTKPSAIYMLGSAILQHSQGIFIAVLYCFLNGEIQNAVKRQLSKAPFNCFNFLPTPRYETERTYIPDDKSGKNRNSLGTPMGEHRYKNYDNSGSDAQLMPTNITNLATKNLKNEVLIKNVNLEKCMSCKPSTTGYHGSSVAPKEEMLLVGKEKNILDNATTNWNTLNKNNNDESLQKIRESVSQFFNENFERYSKGNTTGEVTLNFGAGGCCRPTIAALEKPNSAFSTPPLTRRLTTTSINGNQTPKAIVKSSVSKSRPVVATDYKVNTKL